MSSPMNVAHIMNWRITALNTIPKKKKKMQHGWILRHVRVINQW